MPKVDSLQGAFVEELRDVLDAEKQVLKALPKMARAASSSELRNGFEQHRAQTEEQMERLSGIFEELGEKPRARKCKGMQALIEEGQEMANEVEKGPVRDALLIEAAQKVEHYEIASYGTLRSYATLLGHREAARWLKDTLDEEKATDQRLTQLAETMLNPQAAEQPRAMANDRGGRSRSSKAGSKTARRGARRR